jgi:hypothetical protein
MARKSNVTEDFESSMDLDMDSIQAEKRIEIPKEEEEKKEEPKYEKRFRTESTDELVSCLRN